MHGVMGKGILSFKMQHTSYRETGDQVSLLIRDFNLPNSQLIAIKLASFHCFSLRETGP